MFSPSLTMHLGIVSKCPGFLYSLKKRLFKNLRLLSPGLGMGLGLGSNMGEINKMTQSYIRPTVEARMGGISIVLFTGLSYPWAEWVTCESLHNKYV